MQITLGFSRYALLGKEKQFPYSNDPEWKVQVERVLVYPVYASLDYFPTANFLIGVTGGGNFFDLPKSDIAFMTGARHSIEDWLMISPHIGIDKGNIRILLTYSSLDTHYLELSTAVNLFKPKFL